MSTELFSEYTDYFIIYLRSTITLINTELQRCNLQDSSRSSFKITLLGLIGHFNSATQLKLIFCIKLNYQYVWTSCTFFEVNASHTGPQITSPLQGLLVRNDATVILWKFKNETSFREMAKFIQWLHFAVKLLLSALHCTYTKDGESPYTRPHFRISKRVLLKRYC